MLVCYNGTWLTNDGSGTFPERAITSTIEASLNGKQLVEEGQFLRAIATLPIARGNMSNVFRFKVSRNFQLLSFASNPIAQAEAFILTHFTDLPKSGDLQIVCGGPGETPILVLASGAVLEDTSDGVCMGVGVDCAYSFRCGAIVSLGPGPTPSTVGYDGGVMPVTYTSPLVLDGGNSADTFLNSPLIDGGVLV